MQLLGFVDFHPSLQSVVCFHHDDRERYTSGRIRRYSFLHSLFIILQADPNFSSYYKVCWLAVKKFHKWRIWTYGLSFNGDVRPDRLWFSGDWLALNSVEFSTDTCTVLNRVGKSAISVSRNRVVDRAPYPTPTCTSVDYPPGSSIHPIQWKQNKWKWWVALHLKRLLHTQLKNNNTLENLLTDSCCMRHFSFIANSKDLFCPKVPNELFNLWPSSSNVSFPHCHEREPFLIPSIENGICFDIPTS